MPEYRSFRNARSFARSLELSSQKEWYQYCKGQLKGYPSKPKDIPTGPSVVYKGKGWWDTHDWLGLRNRKISYQRTGHRPFVEARNFTRSLKLSSKKEWYQYCKGQLKGYPSKPKDIPTGPSAVYKGRGWKDTPDWLGYTGGKGFRSFENARNFARSLKLSSQKEWYQYCKGQLKGYPSKPKDIPSYPLSIYKGKGWRNMRDWLGN